MSRKVFISYRVADTRSLAGRLAADLRRVFGDEAVFLDYKNLARGEQWTEQLRVEVEGAAALLVLIGEDWLSMSNEYGRRRLDLPDDWVRQEIAAGLGGTGKVLPLLVNDAKPILAAAIENLSDIAELATIQADFLRDFDWEADLARLVDWLETLGFERVVSPVAEDDATPATPQWPGNPYRGLSSFRPEDSLIYYGREREADELLRKVLAERVVAVIGSSGSGKSSLVAAGLLPQLSEDWVHVRFTPTDVGDNPLRALTGKLAPHLTNTQTADALAERLRIEPADIDAVAAEALSGRDAGAQLLLFADQFEELFTARVDRAYSAPFVALVAAVASSERTRLVLTLRADYTEYFTAYETLATHLRAGAFLLGTPGVTALKAMIKRPARAAGLEVETALVDRIVDDAGTERGSLALVEFTLDQLYNTRKNGTLTLSAYHNLGGVRGAIQEQGDQAVRDANVQVNDTALGNVFRALATVDEKSGVVRKRASLDGLGKDERAIVDCLVDARLLVTNKGADGVATVEVAHEAVLQHWTRFVDWKKKNQEFVLWHQRLQVLAEPWRPSHLDEGALLRGAPLSEAERWHRQRPEELDDLVRVFIESSLVARAAELDQEQQRVKSERELLKRYQMLVFKPQLEEAKRQEGGLFPAWPERREALDEWLSTKEEFAKKLPRLQQELEELRKQAEPWTDKEPVRDLQSHPKLERRKVVSNRPDELATVQAKALQLNEETPSRSTWRFADQGDQFIHDTLALLVAELRQFAAGDHSTLAQVRERLEWASRVERLSISDHYKIWEQATWSIAKADGQNASELYSEHPIELDPQIGLVPIGMNPRTRLWEFYHLRSAFDPSMIPEYDKEARIAVAEHTGIVFVLIPGGTFLMGAQKDDKTAANYDERAEPDEKPHDVQVEPFFLARHEMTQAQWKRLSGGEEPSFYGEGHDIRGDRRPIDLTRPIEQVTWTMCRQLLARHGLALPTEEQWEYGCRGGTETPWSTGLTAKTLSGFANIADETAKDARPYWDAEECVVSEHVDTAPVGFYEANGFGLHDVHGNVWEWCEDSYRPKYEAPEVGPSSTRVYRGGSFRNVAKYARSALRHYTAPSNCTTYLGLRPARKILP